MGQSSSLPAAVRGLLAFNMVLHIASGIFTGIWIADMVAPSGGMSVINWAETILSVAAVSIGLTYGSYMALLHIPQLRASVRRGAIIIFVAAYLAITGVLATAAASVLAAAAGQAAHLEHAITQMKEEIQERRRAYATIINRAPALTECSETSIAMSTQEGSTGAYSREGGDVGRVATTLANIAAACATARDALFASRANLVRLFARMDRLLIDMRRVIDSDRDRNAKLVAARRHGDEFQKLARAVNDALADDALLGLADALGKD